MKKIFMFWLILCGISFGDVVSVESFESDLYSKYDVNNLKKISMDLEIITRDDNVEKAPIYDALNIVVGSFYAEDIMTSKGKESFKSTLTKYIDKKHSITIDDIYIIRLKFVDETNVQKILDAIRDMHNKGDSTPPNVPNIPKIENQLLDGKF